MNKFPHFYLCIGDDPMKEVDPATQQELLSRLNSAVGWNKKDKEYPMLIEILEEMSSFDINMVTDDGTVRLTEFVLGELKKEYESDNL